MLGTTSYVRLAAAIAAFALLNACAVPEADKAIAKATSETATPAGTSGATREADILKRHLAIEEEVAGSPLTAGNRITVLRDGPQTFQAIATAIRGAQQTLNLEYYTIEDVTLEADGTKLGDLLVTRAGEGIAINIIYDAYGSSDTPPDFFTRLAAAGINLLPYHPLGPNPVDALEINDRNHRKILVADGLIGVVGGVNLSTSYESKSPGSDDENEAEAAPAPAPVGTQDSPVGTDTASADAAANPPPQAPREIWRDTALRIEGPAVLDLQTLFRDHWLAEKGPPLDETGFFPETAPKGSEVARIIGSSPADELPRYYVTLISALRSAETRAWISAAYFVPTPEQMETLVEAAERGVDVRLLLADASDSPSAIEAAHSHYAELMEAGIEIYETHDVVLHAKTVVIDGVWSAVGSSNFDYRSVLYNDEVEAIVIGAETARELEHIFEDGMKTANRIDPETWEDDRALPDRLKGFFSRMWEHLL